MNFCGIYIIGSGKINYDTFEGYLTNMHHLRKDLSEQITPHS